jgi:DNA ligase D-like protein (predicted ligase)
MKSKKQLNKRTNFIPPMLATLVEKPFSSSEWIYEKKFDGVRCIACKKDNKVTLYSRNKKSMNSSFPEIVEALENIKKKDFVIDGEIVAFDRGITSFSKLQQRIHLKNPLASVIKNVKVYYYIFDILIDQGEDLRKKSIIERKKILKENFSFSNKLRFSQFCRKNGIKYFLEAKKNGLEGVIAKRNESKYISKRCGDWLKFKCVNQQEFIIIGYTEPQRSRVGFGSILIGYYKNKNLHYAGKVGTGFNQKVLCDLKKKLSRLELKESPIKNEKIKGRGITWIKPSLIAQVGFSEWTKDGKLRHPRFLGIRKDKPIKSIERE